MRTRRMRAVGLAVLLALSAVSAQAGDALANLERKLDRLSRGGRW